MRYGRPSEKRILLEQGRQPEPGMDSPRHHRIVGCFRKREVPTDARSSAASWYLKGKEKGDPERANRVTVSDRGKKSYDYIVLAKPTEDGKDIEPPGRRPLRRARLGRPLPLRRRYRAGPARVRSHAYLASGHRVESLQGGERWRVRGRLPVRCLRRSDSTFPRGRERRARMALLRSTRRCRSTGRRKLS